MAAAGLTDVERKLLKEIMRPNQGVGDLTLPEIAARAGLYEGDAHRALRAMEEEGLVHRDTDAKLEVEFWVALNAAAERLDPRL